MVEASASEFRAVVQSLTGRKRSSASHDRDPNLYFDQYSPQLKLPKHENGLQCLKGMNSSEPELISGKAAVSESCNGKKHGDVGILLEDLEVQPIQIPDNIPSQYQVFETWECFGDWMHFSFPSIPLSEFLYM
jgi:hypothetical protein